MTQPLGQHHLGEGGRGRGDGRQGDEEEREKRGRRRRGGGGRGGRSKMVNMNLWGLWLRRGTPQYTQLWLLFQEVKIRVGISRSFRTEEEVFSAQYRTKPIESFFKNVM